MKKLVGAVLLLAVVAVCAAPAAAGMILTPGTSYSHNYGFPGTVGYEFTPTSNFTVGQLGYFDVDTYEGHEMPNLPHEVAIYTTDGSQTKLVSALIDATNTYEASSGYRWKSVADTELTGGVTYMMAAYCGAGVSFVYQNIGATFAPGFNVALNHGQYDASTDPNTVYPTSFSAGDFSYSGWGGYYMGNLAAPVPEPATMGLLGLGLVGMWMRRKK